MNEILPPFSLYLYQRLAAGDEQALVQIQGLFKGKLFYFTRRILADWQEVEEVVSDSFIALWNAKANFKSDEHIRNFLFVTARNKAIDVKKSKDRLTKRQEGVPVSEIIYDDALEFELARIEMLQQLHHAVLKLPEAYRRIFDLSFHEGKSPSEIGELLNINPATIRSQKRRAFEMLKKFISNESLLLLVEVVLFMREH